MIYNEFTELAGAAVRRYGFFADILRGQARLALARNAVDERARNEVVNNCHDAAREYASHERSRLMEDTESIVEAAYAQALRDLDLEQEDPPADLEDFAGSAVGYTARLLQVQSDTDVMAVAQHVRRQAQRIDLYVRSGKFTPTSAASKVALEEGNTPAFRFKDRLGRVFKSTKRVRDVYRQHLLLTYNEVYIDALGARGEQFVMVAHPDPNYRWAGTRLALVPDTDAPLYYDLRDEIFHPGSNATVTAWREGEDDVPA